MAATVDPNDLPDFGDDNDAEAGNGPDTVKKEGRTASSAIRSSGFRDFLLKPEIIKAIVEVGFEQPAEVQHACIPQAILGTDVLCQAKSGMGKTAVFVIACLQCVEPTEGDLRVLVLGHTRELVYQIEHEFKRFSKHLPDVKTAAIYGGTPVAKEKEMLKDSCPHILIATPGKAVSFLRTGELKLEALTHFVVDECDRCIDDLVLRKDVQAVFLKTPKKKQVMMFSATLSAETQKVCKLFMQDPHVIVVDSESKLTLHGLLQYVVRLTEQQKTRKLIDLLDTLEFNQVVIFVKSVKRALALNGLLEESNFPSMTIHEMPSQFAHKVKAGSVPRAEDTRIDRFKLFKNFQKRILVTTDLFGRGMDVERVNIVVNYDMPDPDMYLHRVGRAGRFGTKGLAVTFVSSEEDKAALDKVQERFAVQVADMPAHVDVTSYLNA